MSNACRPIPACRLTGLAVLLGMVPTASTAATARSVAGEECVILLHGLARTAHSMRPLAKALEKAGFATVNIDYPSRAAPIEKLASEALPKGISTCRRLGARRIHFVTHSMGGILLRHYLAHHRLPELGRVVMLSPPNRGSEIADRMKENRLYRWFNGPAGQELGTSDLPQRLGPVDYPVGVITGSEPAPWDRWFSWRLLPGPDDGKVSVESARLEGMADFLVVPYSHSFIMRSAPVVRQVIHFLRHGRFDHG